MTEALALRLFSARGFKIRDPDDNIIANTYNKKPKSAIIASKEGEEKFLEKEYFLRTLGSHQCRINCCKTQSIR